MVIVLFLQLILEIHDLVLEVELVDVVLCLQGKDLVLSLLRASLAGLGQVVELLDTINDGPDLAVISVVNLILHILLLAADINLLTKTLVLTL